MFYIYLLKLCSIVKVLGSSLCVTCALAGQQLGHFHNEADQDEPSGLRYRGGRSTSRTISLATSSIGAVFAILFPFFILNYCD